MAVNNSPSLPRMLLDRYVAEELPTRFKHVPVSASPLSGFWAVRASVSDLPSAGVELAGRLSTRVKVTVTRRQFPGDYE